MTEGPGPGYYPVSILGWLAGGVLVLGVTGRLLWLMRAKPPAEGLI